MRTTPYPAGATLAVLVVSISLVGPAGASSPPARASDGCKRTPGRIASTFSPYGSGYALGTGPIYPIFGDYNPKASGSAVHYGDGVILGGKWHTVKVLWISAPEYRKSAVVRGKRLGKGEVNLRWRERGALRLTRHLAGTASRPDGWRDWPTTMAIRAPGCYRLTVTGKGLFERITFAATR